MTNAQGNQIRDRFNGTRGALTTSLSKRRIRVRAVAVFNESQTGRGARLTAYVRTILEKRRIKLDPDSDLLLIVRANIQTNLRPDPDEVNPGVPIGPNGQASLSAEPLWRQPQRLGAARVVNPEPEQLDGAALLLRLRGLRPAARGRRVRSVVRGSLYTVHLQLERAGKPPVWQGRAVAIGKSSNPDAALKTMARYLIRYLGRRAKRRTFRTR